MVTELPPQPVIASSSRLTCNQNLDLFLISFVLLFFELTCIRWLSSTVIFLTFFTNLALMASFLGTSVGCLAARHNRDFINTIIPLTLWTVLLSSGSLIVYNLFGRILVDVGGQGSPQQVFFGTEYRPRDPSYFVMPIEFIAGLFFVLIALVFVGLGQVMGRAFNRISNHVIAYTINILGSLAGIVVFTIASNYCTSPVVWFLICVGSCLRFVTRSRVLQLAGFSAILLVTAYFSGYGVDKGETQILWSPYYKIVYHVQRRTIETNNISHQSMVSPSEEAPAYMLPHLLNRDSGCSDFEDVLVIGAGSGNDVQAALAQGARHVDAVEIDPVIYGIGRSDHPDRPYDDPRVSIHIDDGRSFVRRTRRSYDLVSYAVVDSLVLHSGYSSLRLESYLFTEQAFRDVKSKLKPDGVFAMYNYYRQGWVVGRLARLAEKVFGTKPLVLSLPYQQTIGPKDNQANQFTLLLVANAGSGRVEAIRAKLQERQFFWISEKPKDNNTVNAYGPEPPGAGGAAAKHWLKIGPADVDTAGTEQTPTDDWPFLYLRDPTIPAPNLRWILMVAALSVVVLVWFAPPHRSRPNGQMFFLGAGFMLLETKGIVQMALLFGSTWMVNSIIFFAILIMILLSNLFVIVLRPRKRWGLFYGLLTAALVLNIVVPMDSYLILPATSRMIVSCSLVFVPIFFAGIIFALAFRDSQQPDIDIGSNIGGVILGGLSEYFSLIIGFKLLLLVALFFYLLSALMATRWAGFSLNGILPLGSRA